MCPGRATTVVSISQKGKALPALRAEVGHRSRPGAGTELLNRLMAGWRLAG